MRYKSLPLCSGRRVGGADAGSDEAPFCGETPLRRRALPRLRRPHPGRRLDASAGQEPAGESQTPLDERMDDHGRHDPHPAGGRPPGLEALLDLEEGMQVVGQASTGEEGVEKARPVRPDVVVMEPG